MSRSFARIANTASLITLRAACMHSFQDAKRATLRRADLRQRSKDTCTYCQTRYGFDYYVQPVTYRNQTRREAKAYASAAQD